MSNLKKYIKYVIPLAIGIKLGCWIGWANQEVSYVQESRLERIAENNIGNRFIEIESFVFEYGYDEGSIA